MGQGAIFLCAVLWSTSGLFIKLMDWHPIVIAGLRSGIAALFLLAIRLRFPPKWGKNRVPLLLCTGLAYALSMITFVIANKLTTSANVILLQYSAPAWTALLGWVLIRERLHWEQWGALVLVMVGMMIFFKDSLSGGAFAGNCIAVLSGVLLAANSVLLRMQKDGNTQDSLLAAHVICFCIGIPFVYLHPPAIDGKGIVALLFMGIIQIGLASLLFAYGIKRVSAIQAMLTAMIEPVLNPVWVLLVTGERPTVSALVGGGLIVMAVVVSSLIGILKKSAD
jgi:drug/metabolite transporter (DMT)-like permease